MQNGQPINIYSIFRSINGEICQAGQGSWATFIRFAGCNLKCSWCDTEYAQDPNSGKEMSIEEIIYLVCDNKCNNVTITGGEPLLQREGLKELVDQLLQSQYRVSIETNGSLPIIDWRTTLYPPNALSWVVDYKLPSSEQNQFMGNTKPWTQLKHIDYIKFVIANGVDFDVALATVQRFWSEGVKAQFVFSPIVDSPAATLIFGWMREYELFSIPVSVQLHKLINLDEPK